MALPDPQPGMVINYGYVWARQSQAREAGEKDRPCVILAVSAGEDGETSVFAAPITHTKPWNEHEAIALPAATRERLGLDAKECWLMCSEVNEFTWPGFDLRRIAHREPRSCIYGSLPHKLLVEARELLDVCSAAPEFKAVPRDAAVAFSVK